MEMPNVLHEAWNSEHNIRYVVRAYRQLSREEVVQAIRYTLSQTPKRKRPKPGQTLEITTMIQ